MLMVSRGNYLEMIEKDRINSIDEEGIRYEFKQLKQNTSMFVLL